MDRASWIERRKYWTDQVQRWKESGLTQREYCKKKDLSIERFGAWKRRLDHENQDEAGLAQEKLHFYLFPFVLCGGESSRYNSRNSRHDGFYLFLFTDVNN